MRWTRSLAKVPGGTHEKGTKTGVRWQVALDPYTVVALKTLRRQAAERALAAGTSLGDEAYVFARDAAGKVGGRPASRSTPLDATQGLGDDIDIRTVAARGGWANTTTPLEVYAAFVPARDAALALRLAKLLDGDEAADGDDGPVEAQHHRSVTT